MVRTLRVVLAALPLAACSPGSFDDFVQRSRLDAGDAEPFDAASLYDAAAFEDARAESVDARVEDASALDATRDHSMTDAMSSVLDADPTCFAAGSSLISYFPLDGSPDDVHGGAQVSAADARFAAGRVGSALSAGEIAATQSQLDQPSALTISTWLRLDSVPVSLNAPFVWKGGEVGDDYSTNFWLVVAGANFYPENAQYLAGMPLQGNLGLGLTDGHVEQFLLTDSPLPLRSWVHVVATFDGTRARLYVDGAVVRDEAQRVTPSRTTTPLRLSSALGGTVAALPGALDEVAFVSRALTPSEVATLHQQNGVFCR